jgi:hypothetical protein
VIEVGGRAGKHRAAEFSQLRLDHGVHQSGLMLVLKTLMTSARGCSDQACLREKALAEPSTHGGMRTYLR